MSRSKLVRALLALGALLGAAPLMAQAAPTAAAAPVFPYGTYSLVALDSTHGPPPGMAVEFTLSSFKVMRGGEVVETHGLSVSGDTLEMFTLGDSGCPDPGEYRWRIAGKTLTLEPIKDSCGNRAMAIASVTFERQ